MPPTVGPVLLAALAIGQALPSSTATAPEASAAAVVSAIARTPDDLPVVREAVCKRASTPPKIDGKGDDPAWKDAPTLEHFPSFWNGTDTRPLTTTKAKLLWDDEAFYVYAEMTDKELRAVGRNRNDKLWNGDVFEVFLKPRKDAPAYYEFEFNPYAAVLELAIPSAPFDFDKLVAEPSMGITAATTVDGTLDKPGDVDKGWTVEVRIPWSAFAPTGGRPKPGDQWTFALCRYDYGPEGTQPLLMSSAPLRRPSFHKTEDYGTLTFEGPTK